MPSEKGFVTFLNDFVEVLLNALCQLYCICQDFAISLYTPSLNTTYLLWLKLGIVMTCWKQQRQQKQSQARSKRLKTKVKNHRIPMRTTPEAKFVLKSFQKTSEKVRVCGPTKSFTHDQPQVGTYWFIRVLRFEKY